MVEHWVTEERWVKVIDILNRQVSEGACCGIRTMCARSEKRASRADAERAGITRSVLPLLHHSHA